MHGNVEERELPSKPSARQSIHSHNNCIFADNCEQNMGRYGLKSHNNSQLTQLPEKLYQGVDEVDNIQSKLPTSSPISCRKSQNYKGRRNSHTFQESITDDSDIHLLAKSLPANLPSYYSDTYGDQSIQDNFFNSHDLILSSSNASSCDNVNNDSCSSQKSEQRYYSKDEFTQGLQDAWNNMGYKILGVIVVLAAVVCYYSFTEASHEIKDSNSIDVYKFHENMVKIKDKYNIDNDLILEVQSGIDTIFEKNDTGSFIFLYDSKKDEFDSEIFRNFMNEIATTAAQFLRKGSTSVRPTVIHSSQLNMQTYSELMHEYREEVSRTGVMLINDLDRVPSRLAMAFHYFCDEYNPLVPKTAMFFTLNFSKCSHLSDISSYLEVEKCLASKWNTVPKDNIKPLLARVVSVIIDASRVFI